MLTVTNEGAVPISEDRLSQFPVSEVLSDAVQFSVPVPPLRTCMLWLVTTPPLVLRAKLNWPGIFPRNVPAAGATVRVTGMFITTALNCDVTVIFPV